jgi:ABC-type glycerol-3-phosphate transport system substrate-binding protein
MKKNVALLFFTLMVAGGIITGCTDKDKVSSSSAQKVTVRLALGTSYADRLADLLDRWNRENGTVNLVVEKEPNNDLRTKLTTDMAANNMPDIFNYWTKTSLKPFIDNNLLLNIDEYFAKSKVNKRDQWPAAAYRSFNLDGSDTAYGWPFEGSTNILIVNKELFNQYGLSYPATYDELLAVSKVFVNNGIIPIAVGSQHGDAGFWLYSNIFFQYADSRHLVDITTKPDLWKKSDAIRKTSDIILDMATNKVFPGDTMANGLWNPIVALYNEQKAAMMPLFPWTCPNISAEAIARTEWIPVPKMPGAINDPKTFTVGGTNYGLCAYKPSWDNPARQEAMIAVLDMVLGDEAQYELYKYGSLSQKILNSYPPEKEEGIFKLFYDAEKTYQDIPHHMWSMMPDVPSRELYMDLMDGLFARTITTNDFLNQVGDAINQDIAQ